MQQVYMFGKRGLGDLVCGVSTLLRKLNQDTHIIFDYPDGFDYKTTIGIIMDEYTHNIHYNITYEVISKNYNVRIEKINLLMGKNNFQKTWFFSGCNGKRYLPFKTQWNSNRDGPVVLLTNNEGNNSGYPFPEKWFEPSIDNYLKGLMDEKKYIHVGRPKSIKESIEILANCSRVVGVDGGIIHICNAMNVPCILVRNKIDLDLMKRVHKGHSTIKIIETEQIYQYL